jgi:Putative zinc-finger
MTQQDRDQSVEQWLRKTPAPAAPGDLCLDADTLAAWAEGALAGAERASAEAHASTCARCQAMLAVMVRTIPVPERSTGSPIRKWLMMLSPAMAAAAAVALWFAVDQRQPPVPSAVDSLSKAQARDEPVAASPSSTVATEGDRKAPIVSPDRDAQKADRGAEAEPADARRSREVRGPSAAAVPATPAPANERKDLGTPKRSETTAGLDRLPAAAPVASVPPPPPPPTMPAEGFQAAAGNRTPPAPPPPGPAPQQQANQAQNQALNQPQNQAVIQAQSPAVQTQQTQSQGQTPRQQAPAALEERVVIADKPVGRAAAESSATGRAAGRGGTTGALADAAKLAYREGAGEFELAVAASSVRWRVADGRTVQRSLDAGANFSTQYTAESGVLLTAGAAPAANVCWLVGRAGAVILSTDGRVWRRLTFPEQVDLTAVTATDARTATVTTADGRRFGTADGGRTWTRR